MYKNFYPSLLYIMCSSVQVFQMLPGSNYWVICRIVKGSGSQDLCTFLFESAIFEQGNVRHAGLINEHCVCVWDIYRMSDKEKAISKISININTSSCLCLLHYCSTLNIFILIYGLYEPPDSRVTVSVWSVWRKILLVWNSGMYSILKPSVFVMFVPPFCL